MFELISGMSGVLVLVIFALGPQHLSNAYLRASHFDEVIVN